MKTHIAIEKTKSPKQKPATNSLGFGRYFTDHMFLASYSIQKGWHDAKVVPYQPLPLDPGASVLHYGQALFEGIKAFTHKDGKCVIFRPDFNWQRMSEGAQRLCMPMPPKELFLEGLRELIRIDKDWIPTDKGSALYLRPTLIGTEAFLGVRPAEEYLFFTILSPVGSYYGNDSKPVKIWVEEEYVRAAPGGLGSTKAAANYAASLKAAHLAREHSYAQVLWLDVNREYVEEVGTMNVFFVFDNEVVTPSLDGTILGGGTRNSILTLLKSMGKPVVERKVKLSEIREGAKTGRLKEIFGTGTAAVITPVGELAAKDWKLTVNNGEVGPVATHLYAELTGIQQGERADQHGWLFTV